MTSQRKSSGPAARRRTITDPVESPHLADLSLPELRAYRQGLVDEEERVSYWRRLTHARIDLLEAESHTGGTLSMDDLVRVLGDTATGRSRNALVKVRPADPLPELPVLGEMWDSEVDPTDAGAVADAVGRLRAAESQLTEYRTALHGAIDEATGELIVRYRKDPASALSALPEV